MKYIDWNEVKNIYLKTERGIGFEDIQIAIEEGCVLADIDHPLKSKCKNQKVLIVEFDDSAYVVPYFEGNTKIFLKTIYPSRKMTKKYLGKRSKP
ncbi:MAG: toxin [Candidatus Saccharibacteria bacterium]